MAPITPPKEPVQPLTKQQVKKNLADRVFPDFVIQAFNECITESNTKGSTTVMQEDVITRILELGSVELGVLERHTIFENNWLDIELHYKKAGWKVKYDKPGFNESYKAYFVFS
jgi:hypothetical protein